MEISGIGSGIMFALAAGLWLVYLVPSWLKRNEYITTERNAIRLQQTLRILAETAEVPEAVRAETTARNVVEQQKLLKQQAIRNAAEAKARRVAEARAAAEERSLARQYTPPPASLAASPSPAQVAARRLRRVRSITALVLVASVATFGIQVGFLAAGNAAVSAWAVIVFSAIAGVTALAMLSRLAAVGRARAAATARPMPVARRVTMSSATPVATQQRQAPVQEAGWTPVPIPKPLYLSRTQAPAMRFDAGATAAELATAAAEAERVLREAQEASEVTPIRQRPVEATPAAAPSRFASMGILEETADARPDLDEVFARRRIAG